MVIPGSGRREDGRGRAKTSAHHRVGIPNMAYTSWCPAREGITSGPYGRAEEIEVDAVNRGEYKNTDSGVPSLTFPAGDELHRGLLVHQWTVRRARNPCSWDEHQTYETAIGVDLFGHMHEAGDGPGPLP